MHRMPDKVSDYTIRLERAVSPGMEAWWLNFDRADERVARMRFSLCGDSVVVYSIMVFQKYRGIGLGKMIVEMLKERYREVLADRVRYTARDFWSKMGFIDMQDGRYRYCNN